MVRNSSGARSGRSNRSRPLCPVAVVRSVAAVTLRIAMASSALIDEYVDEYVVRRGIASSTMWTLRSTLRRYLRERPLSEMSRESAAQWAGTLPGTAMTQEKSRFCAIAFTRWYDTRQQPPMPDFKRATSTGPPTLAPFVDQFIVGKIRRGELVLSSASRRHRQLSGLARSFGDRPIETLTVWHLEQWLEQIGHLAPSTRHGHVCALKTFCRWLAAHGYIPTDPSAAIMSPRVPRGLPPRLTRLRSERCWHRCPSTRAEVIVLFMLQEALRCGEVSRARLHDVSFADHTLRVVGKGGHIRLLPISAETWAALERYLDESPAAHGPVVRSYRPAGAALTPHTISMLVVKWMRNAALKRHANDGISAHACRHTATTDMLRSAPTSTTYKPRSDAEPHLNRAVPPRTWSGTSATQWAEGTTSLRPVRTFSDLTRLSSLSACENSTEAYRRPWNRAGGSLPPSGGISRAVRPRDTMTNNLFGDHLYQAAGMVSVQLECTLDEAINRIIMRACRIRRRE